MNNPAATCGASELGVKISLKGVLECSYRGVQFRTAWIPA
jgi:hypothetical protein